MNSRRTVRIHIHQGHVVDPANGVDRVADLFIADGRVVGVGSAPAGFVAERTLDASNLVVCPGLVDLCANLREPGQEHKATIASETRAAAAAGITTLCCPPNADPVVDTPAVIDLIHHRASQAGMARVLTLGALTVDLGGTQLSNMASLKEAGCVGVSNGARPMANSLFMRRAMEYAATFDLTVFLHPQDESLRGNGCVHEGPISTRLGLPGIPEAAETVAVARDLALIEQTGARAHFCRLSTARAVRMISRAQYDGLPVTADVAAHQLHLTDIDVSDFNSQCHVIPPLRSQRDCEALLAGIAKGTIAAITSDHQPHEADAKLDPFSETEPGISALETLLPLTLRLVDSGQLDLSGVVTKLSWQPAQILGIDAGRLGVGDRADICIFDPHTYWEVTPALFVSRGRNTPFAGWELKGRVMHTLLAGDIVFSRAAQ
jgi:dihydroorotase